MFRLGVSIYLFFSTPMGFADEGLLSNGSKRIGSIYWTVCNGQGPSFEQARQEAINNCKIAASDQLQTSIRSNVWVVNTENNSGIHEEIKDEKQITNLICEPTKEEIKESAGFFQAIVQCKFNLALATVADTGQQTKSQPFAKPEIPAKKRITIATIPKCDSILIVGKVGDLVKCKSNPVTLVIGPSTEELIIRASNYKPYRINKELGGKDSVFQITLEPL